jgi:hypothetical protein
MECNTATRISKRPCSVAMLCFLLVSGCAFHRTPDQVDDLLSQALRAAETHHEFELDAEAALLIDAISAVDGDYPGLRDLSGDLDPGAGVGIS